MRVLSAAIVTLIGGLSLVPATSQVDAQETRFCAVVESRGEGHWPVPEEAFTQARAQQALETIAQAVSSESVGAD